MRIRKDGVQFVVLVGLVTSLVACGGSNSPPANQPPVADAGIAQTSAKRAVVTLDGSASHDAEGESLTYAWSQTAGTAVTLSDVKAVKPKFTAPAISGTLAFALTVSDGRAASAAATALVTVTNTRPTASAGADTTVAANATVSLDGTASADPDSDPLTYEWTQTSGSPVILDTSVAGHATFVAPRAADVLRFLLVVNDGEVDSAPAIVTITVTAPPVPLPSAVAGADITTPKRSVVTLQGTGSDPQGKTLTYQWQQTAGSPVVLQNAATAVAQFTAPAVVVDLQFALTVNNGAVNSLPSTVTVHVQNVPPTLGAITFSNPAPLRNDAISVQVSAYDADSDPLTLSYVWKRNGMLVPAVTASYPVGNQAKNDVISVDVTVSDGTATATSSASVIIGDTPAVLTGNTPTSATYGQPLSFQLTASDVDGDPTGPIEVAYAPAGFSVSAAGLVTWTPSGPLFDRATDMAWQVRLHNAPQITLGGTITVNDAARKYPLARTNAGIPVGNNAIDVEDFDGDGKQEILVGTYASLYILAKNGPTDYAQSWVYPFDPAASGNANSGQSTTFNAVTSGDVDGDGHREIFFSQGPVIVELDGVTRREVARYGDPGSVSAGTPALGPYCSALKYADIDNDGAGELVCLGSNGVYGSPTQLYVLDAKTMTLKWQSGVLNGGTSMAIGNVDNDPALEIVTSDGFVFDGATHQNQWAYGPGFGSMVDIGDVTGDGIGKIVGVAMSSATVIVYSAIVQSPIWQISTGSISGTSALKVSNLDGVGPAEILLGDGQWGNVTVYRYDASLNTASVVSQINSQGDGVSAIGVGDVDGDGAKEMIWGSDFVSSGPDTLAIASWMPTPVIKWKGPDGAQLDGPFVGAKNALVAAGQNRLMFGVARTNSGYSGTRIIALDPSAGLFTLSNELDSNWSGDGAFDVGNVYGSSLDSILVGTAATYDGYFTAYDFAGNTKSWNSGKVGDGVAVTHADLNHDSVADVVGITAQGYVYAWDVLHQTLLWSSTQLTGGKDVAAVDLDGDGQPEIIALAYDRVVVYKYSSVASGYLENASYAITGTDLLVADTDGDGVPEIFVLTGNSGGGNGSITQFNPSLQILHQYTVGAASSFYLEESAFSRKNLIITPSNDFVGYPPASRITAIDPATGTMIWQSPYISGTVPINSLSFNDYTGDGQLKMVFGTSQGMYVTR